MILDVLGRCKLVWRVNEPAQSDLIMSVIPRFDHLGGLKGEEKLEKIKYYYLASG